MQDYRELRRGIRRVRTKEKCSNGHPLVRGQHIAFYVGIVDYQFTDHVECRRCDAGPPYHAPYSHVLAETRTLFEHDLHVGLIDGP